MNSDRVIDTAAARLHGLRSDGGVLQRFFRVLLVAFALPGVVLATADSPSSNYTLSVLAGLPGGPGNINGTGSVARFTSPQAVAVDGSGNLYVADTGDNIIRKVTPSGVVTTLAGTAVSCGNLDSSGTAAQFCAPAGIAVDRAGNVYVADTLNNTIRKITPAGAVTTLAGMAQRVGSVDGAGSAARFNSPASVGVDGNGNVYVADSGNSTIRMITPGGVVTTLAGTAGQYGSDDGTGPAARFYQPSGIATDASGNVYASDRMLHDIRKISPSGVVTTLAGSPGQNGNSDGTGTSALFNAPAGLAVDGGGNVYVADRYNGSIRKVTQAGVVATLPASFSLPAGVALDGSGNLFVVASGDNDLSKITPAGTVTILAGAADHPGNSNGSGASARFNIPFGIAVDGGGNVYVADSNNQTIREVTSTGVVSTLAGTAGQYGSTDGSGTAAQFFTPGGVAVDGSGNVYVADTNNQVIRKITSVGVVSTLAGVKGQYGNNDGTGSAASFSFPQSVAVDGSGNVYVADTDNDTIRKITAAGVVTTLAGMAYQYGSSDGAGSTARFNLPQGVAVDSGGNVYVADTGNNTIRKITPAGVVTTLAGMAQQGGNSSDGNGSAARFSAPQGIAVDGGGNVLVADYYSSTLRMITPAGDVTTLFGQFGVEGLQSGPGPGVLNLPHGVAVTADASRIFLSMEEEIVVASTAAASSLVPATPGFSPAAGEYSGPQSVTITDGTSGASIYYTVDGSIPTSASTQYAGPILVSASETIQAIATAAGSSSAVATASYTIDAPSIPAQVMGLIASPGNTSVSLAWSPVSGATSYTVYGGTASGGETAIASGVAGSGYIASGLSNGIPYYFEVVASNSAGSGPISAEVTATPLPMVAPPMLAPASGTYAVAQTVKMGDSTPGATIYYTIDGSTPTKKSTQYSAPISVASSERVRAIASAGGYTDSNISSATYTINSGGGTSMEGGTTTGGMTTGETSGSTTRGGGGGSESPLALGFAALAIYARYRRFRRQKV